MATKEELARDVNIVTTFSSKYNLKNPAQVEKLIPFLAEKKPFTTQVGTWYIERLNQIKSGTADSTCFLCKKNESHDGILCDACMSKYTNGKKSFYVKKEATPTTQSADGSIKTEEMKRQTQETIQNLKKSTEKAVDNFTEKINTMAGGSGKVDLRFKDLFSAIFKKHEKNEAEAIFICGTSTTTPEAKDISTEWPKPWLYSRIALLLFASFYVLLLCYTGFQNPNVIPDIIFIGSCMVPVSILMFFFEVNAPRNISIFNICKIFLLGGVASIFITLLLFQVFSYDSLDFVGAIVVGIVEELGKFFVVAYYIKKNKYLNYILNGMLVGAAVGAGFAVLESAGYAMRFYLTYLLGGGYGKAFEGMVEVIYNRGILSPGGHIAWAAITGAAIVIVMEHGSFDTSRLKSKKFLGLFALPVIMHAVWDMPINLIQIGPFELQHIALVVIAWIIILVLLHRGLEEINHE